MKADLPLLVAWAVAMLSPALPALGDIAVYSLETREIQLEIKDAPSLFGGSIPLDGLRGLLVKASPADACAPVLPPPRSNGNYFGKWILLIRRNSCSFEMKVRNAQAAGYVAAIVHNINSSSLQPMGADNSTGITIPSVFIGSDDGLELGDSYLFNSGFYICINHDLPFDITIHMLLIFSILVGVCFLGMVVFIVIKYLKDRRRQQRHRLPKNSLKQIPVHKFKKNDPFDTCVICLEDYVEGEKLRVLPCLHAYHKNCIDPWLTKNRRVCPVCKRRVLTGGPHATDSESESEDEARPLLRGASSSRASGDTFITQPENPFQRARRHFLGMAESLTSSISSSNSGTSEYHDINPSLPSVAVDVESTSETRSLQEEPSVNA